MIKRLIEKQKLRWSLHKTIKFFVLHPQPSPNYMHFTFKRIKKKILIQQKEKKLIRRKMTLARIAILNQLNKIIFYRNHPKDELDIH